MGGGLGWEGFALWQLIKFPLLLLATKADNILPATIPQYQNFWKQFQGRVIMFKDCIRAPALVVLYSMYSIRCIVTNIAGLASARGCLRVTSVAQVHKCCKRCMYITCEY